MKVATLVDDSTVAMPPSAKKPIDCDRKPILVPIPPPDPVDLSKNVIAAYNYEVSIVDEFVAAVQKRRRSSLENDAPPIDSMKTPKQNSVTEHTRRSARDKGKREVPTVRARVRYDMQKVPCACRNQDFLKVFERFHTSSDDENNKQTTTRRSSLRLSESTTGNEPTKPPLRNLPQPFLHDSTVLWIPQKRGDWEDCLDELTAVCTSAALRKHNMAKPFLPPLSHAYIRDRVDIDDPLMGYQLRHKTGGWLQGFMMFTTFTTWTHGFRWNTLDHRSGIDSSLPHTDDGTLSKELESLPRSGDPLREGIVFSQIAEIGLVGALGCGEYLVRMALEQIRRSGRYKYVVLQATDMSKTFYERFGFVRVGAVCRYMGKGKAVVPSSPEDDQPLVGYRHWTHANESEISLNLHGGPSYMMCLKVEEPEAPDSTIPSFLEAMKTLQVDQKPTIAPLGNGIHTPVTPGRKSDLTPANKKKQNRRVSTPQQRKSVVGRDVGSAKTNKRTMSGVSMNVQSAPKRRRTTNESIARDSLMSPPRNGIMTYAQKQYQSAWLAVPPQPSSCKRGAPKNRDSSTPTLRKTKTAAKSDKTSAKHSNCLVDGKGRPYHSVRGPDGRFTRVYSDEVGFSDARTPSSLQKSTNTLISTTSKSGRKRSDIKLSSPTPSVALRPGLTPVPLSKAISKQKVRSYPRSVLHYYNRVVKPNSGTNSYYFVLNYDPTERWIRAVPLHSKGVLSGQRQGRPRYQAVVEDTDSNLLSASVDDYQVVSATMVMKTPLVAQEAWDIEDD